MKKIRNDSDYEKRLDKMLETAREILKKLNEKLTSFYPELKQYSIRRFETMKSEDEFFFATYGFARVTRENEQPLSESITNKEKLISETWDEIINLLKK